MEKTISLLTVLIFFLFLLSACKIHTELTASNKKIEFGDSVVLTWKTTNAKNIKINNGVGDNLPASGSITVCPKSEANYYSLRAWRLFKGNYESSRVTVYAHQPKIISFYTQELKHQRNYKHKKEMTQIRNIVHNDMVKLFWEVENANYIEIVNHTKSNNNIGNKSIVAKDNIKSFILIAHGKYSNDTAIINVDIKAYEIIPESGYIYEGLSGVLDWNVSKATSIVFNNKTYNNIDKTIVSPVVTTNYDFIINYENGNILKHNIEVEVRTPYIESFSSNAPIVDGTEAKLSWTVFGASRIDIVGVETNLKAGKGVEGSKYVSPNRDSTFKLKIYYNGKTKEQEHRIKVVPQDVFFNNIITKDVDFGKFFRTTTPPEKSVFIENKNICPLSILRIELDGADTACFRIIYPTKYNRRKTEYAKLKFPYYIRAGQHFNRIIIAVKPMADTARIHFVNLACTTPVGKFYVPIEFETISNDLDIENIETDFGQIDNDLKVTKTIRIFTNNSDEHIVIKDISLPDSATQFVIHDWDKNTAIGESAYMHVTYVPNQTGDHKAAATVVLENYSTKIFVNMKGTALPITYIQVVGQKKHSNTNIFCYDYQASRISAPVSIDDAGNYIFQIPQNRDISIVEKERICFFATDKIKLSTSNYNFGQNAPYLRYEVGTRIDNNKIIFDDNSAELTRNSISQIYNVLHILRKLSSVQIFIDGIYVHNKDKKIVSMRTKAIKDFLIKQGIDSKRIKKRLKKETENSTENVNRVEITISVL